MNNPTNTPETIQDLLIKLHHDGYEKGLKQHGTPYSYTLDEQPKAEALAALSAMVFDQIIGEDDELVQFGFDEDGTSRNNLRAEQRKKAAALGFTVSKEE